MKNKLETIISEVERIQEQVNERLCEIADLRSIAYGLYNAERRKNKSSRLAFQLHDLLYTIDPLCDQLEDFEENLVQASKISQVIMDESNC